MAPHRTPQNKKQQQNVLTSHANGGSPATSPIAEALPDRPAMASQAAEAAQEDEREALKAIFMDDYEESEARGAWSVSGWQIACCHQYASDPFSMVMTQLDIRDTTNT
jgi:translation initiation factor 2-alpha kinase 4